MGRLKTQKTGDTSVTSINLNGLPDYDENLVKISQTENGDRKCISREG